MINETLFSLTPENFAIASVGGIFAGMLVTFFVAFVCLMIFSYLFKAFAYMTIAKKIKQGVPGISFIPGIGPLIVAFKSSKMHWWPWLLLIGIVLPIIGEPMLLVFGVITVYWHWKMFESVKRPGWWAILAIIPIVEYFVLGFAAWGKREKLAVQKKPAKKSSSKKRR